MTHPLVDQLRFTRSEWLRGLLGVSEEDAARHFGAMNCISWNVGHLAWHEQRTFLERPQGNIPFPKLNELFTYGARMNTPSFAEMLCAGSRTITGISSGRYRQFARCWDRRICRSMWAISKWKHPIDQNEKSPGLMIS